MIGITVQVQSDTGARTLTSACGVHDKAVVDRRGPMRVHARVQSEAARLQITTIAKMHTYSSAVTLVPTARYQSPP